jgi:hypothetical protein
MNRIRSCWLGVCTFGVLAVVALQLAGDDSAKPKAVATAEVHRWGVFETSLTATRDYAEPIWDVRVEVTFVAPSGKKHVREAFWDGGRVWRVRFSPDEIGTWQWSTQAKPEDIGLHRQQGEFRVREYTGDNPLYRHGALRVAASGTYLEHADGTPFFWLADTAWNGVLKSQPADWQRYLATRQKQGFTAVQFVSTQWRGGNKTLKEHVFGREAKLRVYPQVLARMDAKLAQCNAYHLVAVPVLLWALTPTDPGEALSENEAQRLCEYLISRWGAYQVVWLLGGDGHYRNTQRWQRLGRQLFTVQPRDRLVSLHPSGQNWIWDRFGNEAWIDFLGYQSGHGDNEAHLRWLIEGPPAKQWLRQPPKPIINLEPNYEAHPSYHSRQLFQPYHVRRAAYWSLLIAPPAGVTYGHHHIWPWLDQPGPVEGHERLGQAGPWTAGLEAPGAQAMGILKAFFLSGPWTELRPANQALVEQPGEKAPERFVAVSATPKRTWLVAYLPQGGTIRLRREFLPAKLSPQWFDPRTGKKQPANAELHDKEARFVAPDDQDWVLDIRPE